MNALIDQRLALPKRVFQPARREREAVMTRAVVTVTRERYAKCAVCRSRMPVERSTKRVCSDACRMRKMRRTRKRHACLRSDNQTWQTPSVVLDRVRKVASIALDPCPGRGSLVQPLVPEVYHPERDGLAASWAAEVRAVGVDGIAFVNPPYGGAQKHWLAKAIAERDAGLDTIALVALRPGTVWWHETVVDKAALVCHWRGRITFVGATETAAFESAVILYSCDARRQERFRAAFSDVGRVMAP
jgi:hypothetical protein